MLGFKRKKGKEEQDQDVVSEYATLLEKGGEAPLRPESSLPAPKDEIREALIAEALAHWADDDNFNAAHMDALRTAYFVLADFVEDDLAEKGVRFFQMAGKAERVRDRLDELQPHEGKEFVEELVKIDFPVEAISRKNDEALRLMREFDEIVENFRQKMNAQR